LLVGYEDKGGRWQRGDLDRELERLGFAADGTIRALDGLVDPLPHEVQAYRVAEVQLLPRAQKARVAVRLEIVERAAYSWINRLLALRAMEARELIEETLRHNPEYEGLSEALFILRDEQPQHTMGADAGWWAVLEQVSQRLKAALPGVFDPNDPAVALRPTTSAFLRCVALVGGELDGFTLEESDAAFAEPDAIGWAYQFYQEEAKARTYAKLKAGGKIETRSEIAAATQLFTEPYMVQWLLQNSLGRSYHDAHPTTSLVQEWDYYIDRSQLEVEALTQEVPVRIFQMEELTVIDPCMGSGHFLREAFDMLVAMWREQEPQLNAKEIADRVLQHHLFGIDLDPRAAQLTALTLYLRAWELIREERHAKGFFDAGEYLPPAMNLATTPRFDQGALARHLQRHPEDELFKPVLEGIFAALEQADLLGSLLRPAEQLQEALAAFNQNQTIPMGLNEQEAALRRSLTELRKYNPAELKHLLLARVADSFATETESQDVATALFGREASQGVRLLQLLDRRYAVVVTNPPYMGSKNMDKPLKTYVQTHYTAGKRDLYAAFILRSLDLSHSGGRVAMITQQSWMFLRSFADLRALPQDKLANARKKGNFTGLLRETSIEALAHLGANAFEEISGEVVQSVMFTIANHVPNAEHRMVAFRLTGLKSAGEKADLLQQVVQEQENESVSTLRPIDFLAIPETPLVYWLSENLVQLLVDQPTIGRGEKGWLTVRDGINTGDNNRFVRLYWEVNNDRWKKYSKGGGYAKWTGLEYYAVDWGNSGKRIKSAKLLGTALRNIQFFFQPALCYSLMARGALGVRFINDSAYDGAGLSIQSRNVLKHESISALLNCRLVSYFVRLLSQDIKFRGGYVERTPQPISIPKTTGTLAYVASQLKNHELSRQDLCERRFQSFVLAPSQTDNLLYLLYALRHTIEGLNESLIFSAYQISERSKNLVISETGTPAGWHPLIAGYDTVPDLPDDLDLPPLPQEVFEYLAQHERLQPSEGELAQIKSNLRALYEAGPGAKTDKLDLGELAHHNDELEGTSGAYIPIPTETFLEELSVKLQLHPISVYWLLHELRSEGVRCKPEEKRVLEDRLSVLVLRLLGHRWPKQLEANESVPAWADEDGIIPLTASSGEATLAERVRERLQAEDGPLGAQRTEALLQELTGRTVEEWLRREFFVRHVKQFKKRPIAWHLASTPASGGKSRKSRADRQPAFECLLYYHATASDVLARLRTQYVEPLLRNARKQADNARRNNDNTQEAVAVAFIHELETFTERLRQVEEAGFACKELDKRLAKEPLDRWAGDGYTPPTTRNDLILAERAWNVDLNDGVRVNIAPLQQAELLSHHVLNTKKIAKAISDRTRWRADERRWVRAGNLPRCGWMEHDVPASQKWNDLAPQRAAEQAKLAEKRRAALVNLGESE